MMNGVTKSFVSLFNENPEYNVGKAGSNLIFLDSVKYVWKMELFASVSILRKVIYIQCGDTQGWL